MLNLKERSMYNIIFNEYITVIGLKIVNNNITADIIKSEDVKYKNTDSIPYIEIYNEYIKRVHYVDLEVFNSLFSLENLMNSIYNNQKINSVLLFKDSEDLYNSYNIETFINNNSDNENYNMIITSKRTGYHRNLLEDSIRILYKDFYKVLKVDLGNDTYQEIKLMKNNQNRSFTKVCNDFVNNVYYEDQQSFTAFINDIMTNKFIGVFSKKRTLRFRMSTSVGLYRWVNMSVIPCKDYDEEKNNFEVMVYLRDIHDDFNYQLSEQRTMYYLSTHDALTGMKNRFAYETDKYNCRNKDMNCFIFIKIKDTMSDISTKRIIDVISNSLYYNSKNEYRISNDEFYIFINYHNKDKLTNQLMNFKKSLQESKVYINFKFINKKSNINEIISACESEM